MGNNLLRYKDNSLWIGDWWISLSAFFLLECINEGNYDEGLNPYKDEIITRLQYDTNGFIAGALDLGTDIIIEANLIQPYVKTLEILKEKIASQGKFINSDKCKEIDNLNFDPHIGQEFNPVATKDLIAKVNEIINLFVDNI